MEKKILILKSVVIHSMNTTRPFVGDITIEDGIITKIEYDKNNNDDPFKLKAYGNMIRPERTQQHMQQLVDTIDMKYHHIYPGFIDAHSHIGLSRYEGVSKDECNEFSRTINSDLHIVDSYNPFSDDVVEALKSGIFISQVCPGSGPLIGGLCGIVRVDRYNVFNSIINDKSAMKISLGENPGKYNNIHTQARLISLLREFMTSENEFAEEIRNLDMPLKIHCHSPHSIMNAIKLIDRYGVTGTLDHCTGIRTLLKHCGDISQDKLFKNKSIILGPLLGGKSKVELHEKSFDICKYLKDRDIEFAISTDCCEMYPSYNLFLQAKMLYTEYGWNEYDSLSTITSIPAKIMGIDDKYGTIDVGKVANFIITDRPIFERYVLKNGILLDGEYIKLDNATSLETFKERLWGRI